MLKIQFRDDVKGVDPNEISELYNISHKRFLCKIVNSSDIPIIPNAPLSTISDNISVMVPRSNNREKLIFSNSDKEFSDYVDTSENIKHGYRSKNKNGIT